MIPADFIEHDHIEWGRCRPLFVKTAHMEPHRIWASVNELVDGSLVAMEGKREGRSLHPATWHVESSSSQQSWQMLRMWRISHVVLSADSLLTIPHRDVRSAPP